MESGIVQTHQSEAVATRIVRILSEYSFSLFEAGFEILFKNRDLRKVYESFAINWVNGLRTEELLLSSIPFPKEKMTNAFVQIESVSDRC